MAYNHLINGFVNYLIFSEFANIFCKRYNILLLFVCLNLFYCYYIKRLVTPIQLNSCGSIDDD